MFYKLKSVVSFLKFFNCRVFFPGNLTDESPIVCPHCGQLTDTECMLAPGRLCPEVQPLTLSCTILAEKALLLYIVPFIEKRYPFHIPILGSLVLVFM